MKKSEGRRRKNTRNGSLMKHSENCGKGKGKEKLNTSKTRTAKARAQEEYTQVNKEVKRRTKGTT